MTTTHDVLLLIGFLALAALALNALVREVVADLRGDEPRGLAPIRTCARRREVAPALDGVAKVLPEALTIGARLYVEVPADVARFP